jgi:uncharacterized protein
VKITYDPAKRAATLRDRGLDFEAASEVFAGVVIDIPDERFDYGEVRTMTVGHLRGRMVVVIWTARGDVRHVISMRKANGREQARFGNRFGED